MARGKEAVAAANRREQAAKELLRSMTDELSELKVELRLYRARNAQLSDYEARYRDLDQMVNEDTLYQDALAACHEWKRQADAQRARQQAAIKEWPKIAGDLNRVLGGLSMSKADYAELLFRRYPALLGYLLGRELTNAKERPYATKEDHNAKRQLSDDGLRRFQRAIGARAELAWAKDKDAADVYNDLLDAVAVGLSAEEVMEYIGADQCQT